MPVISIAGRLPQHGGSETRLRRREAPRAAVTDAALDWLDSQIRVLALWRDLLVERDGDLDLVADFDRYAQWLAHVREDHTGVR